MTTFRVRFRGHYPDEHHVEYLQELGDFASWRQLGPSEYLLIPHRANKIALVRDDLLRQQDRRELFFEEIEE